MLDMVSIILNAYLRADDATDRVSETEADVGSDGGSDFKVI